MSAIAIYAQNLSGYSIRPYFVTFSPVSLSRSLVGIQPIATVTASVITEVQHSALLQFIFTLSSELTVASTIISVSI